MKVKGGRAITVTDHDKMGKTRISLMSLLKIGLYGLLMALIYYSSVIWLITFDWAKRPDTDYGYLIPFVIIYLIWERRKKFTQYPIEPSWYGMIPFSLGFVLFWLGELSGEFYSLYISLWFIIVGILWMQLGWRKIRTIAFALILGLSMFPIPNFLYQKISVKLKLISSRLGVAMLHLYGMSVYREGNIIDLGFTKLQVVDACSGLRYLIPLIITGLILAYFFKTTWWKRTIVVTSTIPLAIFTNGIRIGLTGILCEVWNPEAAEGFFHGFSGWFIFMLTLGILLVEMKALNKIRSSEGKSLSHEESLKQLDTLNTQNLHKAHTLKKKLISIISLIFLAATFGLSRGINFREEVPIMKTFSQFPIHVNEWTGVRQNIDQEFIKELDLSDYVVMDYHNQNNKSVSFYVAYYESQRKGESIHSPATCLPGSGWIFHESGTIDVDTPGHYSGSMKVNRAIMQKIGYKQLSYYWFPQRGRILTNAYQLKIFTLWDALTKHRTDGALVRIITPVYEFEEIKHADARLQQFIRTILPTLKEYIPGEEITSDSIS